MRSLFSLAPKPSDLIQAMITGLKFQDSREDFFVDMGSFAGKRPSFGDEGETCFGCAATCALQQLSGVNLTSKIGGLHSSYIRSSVYKLDPLEVSDFEIAIDALRKGDCATIIGLYGVSHRQWPEMNLPMLRTDNWRKKIMYYQRLVEALKVKGL